MAGKKLAELRRRYCRLRNAGDYLLLVTRGGVARR